MPSSHKTASVQMAYLFTGTSSISLQLAVEVLPESKLKEVFCKYRENVYTKQAKVCSIFVSDAVR